MRVAAFLFAALAGLPVAHAEETRAAIEDRRVLMSIEQLQEASDWKTRLEAAIVLGRSGDIRARRPLVTALRDSHYAVRVAAIRSLTNLGDVRAIRPILDLLDDDEPFVRTEAKTAIEELDLDAERPYLVHALRHHPSRRVRESVLERLASRSTKESIRSLLEAIGDEDE